MGFIADPAPRKVNLSGFKVGATMDPATSSAGQPKNTATLGTKVAIKPSPLRVVPVVRDHTLPNPNAVPPNYHGPGRSDSINGGGLGLGNPFSFTAPLQFEQIRDNRSSANPSGRKGGHGAPWTPNTQGPANSGPKKP
jgi:hypothetical protein